MRPYEIMVIRDPTLDERTVAPSLETFLNTVSELDRQLGLNESVLRTKVMRTDKH